MILKLLSKQPAAQRLGAPQEAASSEEPLETAAANGAPASATHYERCLEVSDIYATVSAIGISIRFAGGEIVLPRDGFVVYVMSNSGETFTSYKWPPRV